VIIYDSAFYEPCKYTFHAEQVCIKRCRDKNVIKKSTMILVRKTGNTDNNNPNIHPIKEVRPCKMCQHIIEKYKLRRIICLAI
jgi:hypothetical protein